MEMFYSPNEIDTQEKREKKVSELLRWQWEESSKVKYDTPEFWEIIKIYRSKLVEIIDAIEGEGKNE